MDFAGLKSAVESTLARTDIPAHIYEIATSILNTRARILSMQTTATISASAETAALPSDFLEAVSVYIDTGGFRNALRPMTDDAQNFNRYDTGRPIYYTIINGNMKFMPAPDGTYSVELRYFQKLAALSADTDTNDVLTDYPSLYLYLALSEAAKWAQDAELAVGYSGEFEKSFAEMESAEKKKRLSGPIVRRPSVDISRRC